MNQYERALFLLTYSALQENEETTSESGLIENTEPMTATCQVEYSDNQ